VPFDRAHFSELIAELGFPSSIASFDGPGEGECYVIQGDGSGWAVYYAERGLRSGERAFPAEADALHYLLGWIVADNLR